MRERLSYGQLVILRAAAQVDQLDMRAPQQINLPYGVWRSLVCKGLLRQEGGGWQITEEGREVLRGTILLTPPRTYERFLMDGKLPRYAVARTQAGWAVIDRHISKIKMHNDVVETYDAREAARIRARELNIHDKASRDGAQAAE